MLKVVIVDDERDVLDRLAHMLDQIETDFVLTNSYENGIDAYNGIISDPPDLLITDIRIPYIDGIELARLAKEVDPFMKIIIITGYDMLDYTKQAIELEVIGYVTKPTSIHEFSKVVKKAEKRIKDEYDLYNKLTELNQFKVHNLPVIRDHDLNRLLDMDQVSLGFQKKLKNIGIQIDEPYLTIGVFDSDYSIEEIDLNDLHLLYLSLKQNIEEHCPYKHESFIRGDQLVILLFNDEPFRLNEIESIFRLELKRIGRFSNISLSLGFSEVASQPFRYQTMFQHANKALEMRQITGGESIYFYETITTTPETNYTLDEAALKHLIYLIKYKTSDEIWTYLNELHQLVVQPTFYASYNLHVSSILNTILQSCDDITKLYQQYTDCKDIYMRLMMTKTSAETFELFKAIIEKIRSINDSMIDNAIDLNLQKIEDYIEANYTDEDISLTVVSDKVNLSPGYISLLLKNRYNMTFVKYLTTKRLEKAVELLSNPQFKIVDVARQVGYTDPYYFSHCFKKHYHMTPREYRENAKKTG